MSTTQSRKRRKLAADISVSMEIAASRPKDEQIKEPPIATVSASADNDGPTLPAAVSGRVLDCLINGEVCQVILPNILMSNIVPDYVEAIHIRKPGDSDVVAARRFLKVKAAFLSIASFSGRIRRLGFVLDYGKESIALSNQCFVARNIHDKWYR